MPVPKGKEKLYGMIVGANINRGKSLEAAKTIADRAVKPQRAKEGAASGNPEHPAGSMPQKMARQKDTTQGHVQPPREKDEVCPYCGYPHSVPGRGHR